MFHNGYYLSFLIHISIDAITKCVDKMQINIFQDNKIFLPYLKNNYI